MPLKYQIVAALGSVAAYRLITHPLRTKYTELARAAIEINKENDVLREQMAYLVNVINEQGVELDEFDLIVLTNVNRA